MSNGSYELIERVYKSDGGIENQKPHSGNIRFDSMKNTCVMEKVFGSSDNWIVHYKRGYLYVEMPVDGDMTMYIVFSRMNTIKGTFGGSNNGTTSKITFNGDGTGRYQLSGNMESDQSFTYAIVSFDRFEATGVKYQVKASLEAGMELKFDVYPENIVGGEIVKLNKDMPRQ